MAENKYIGGIQINTSGFEVKASAPVDSRFRVKNAEGLLELLTYEGLVSYNEADKKYYRFAEGEWKALSVNTPEELEALIKNSIATETTGAMEFKGATASLPENPDKGDMYKVSGQFAVGEETAKVGDTIVYNGEKWFLIPSGDDMDTWRPVKVGENTLDQTETLELVAGENVTITENEGKITISSSYENTHYESKLVVGNEIADATDENVVENGNAHLNLVEDGVVKSSHKIVGAGGISVTHTKAEGENGVNVITITGTEGISRTEVEDIVNDAVDTVKDELSTQNIAVLAEAQKYTDEQITAIPATSWNDLTDKPFGTEVTEGVITLEGDFTDRDYGDREYIVLGDTQTVVKVSDKFFTADDLMGAVLNIAYKSGEVNNMVLSADNVADGATYDMPGVTTVVDNMTDGNAYVVSISSEGAANPSIPYPQGTWFFVYFGGNYSYTHHTQSVSCITGEVETTKPLDEKYIPDTIARVQDIEVFAKDYDAEGNEKVSGLKVQNKNEIAIDDSVIFVLDCNW